MKISTPWGSFLFPAIPLSLSLCHKLCDDDNSWQILFFIKFHHAIKKQAITNCCECMRIIPQLIVKRISDSFMTLYEAVILIASPRASERWYARESGNFNVLMSWAWSLTQWRRVRSRWFRECAYKPWK